LTAICPDLPALWAPAYSDTTAWWSSWKCASGVASSVSNHWLDVKSRRTRPGGRGEPRSGSTRRGIEHGQHTDLTRAVPEQAQRPRPLGSGAHRAVPHPRDQDCSGTSPAATASSLSDATNAARRRGGIPLTSGPPADGSDRSDQIQTLTGDVDRDLTTISGIHTASHESLAHQSIAQPSTAASRAPRRRDNAEALRPRDTTQ
jgi:hypothetical protein